MRAARTTVLEKAKRLTRILLPFFLFSPRPFTRHWKQVKNENADGYLKELGFPFMIRKIAVGPMGKSTDIVKQAGDVQVVTTINVKGSWTRKFIIDKKISQANAEGDECETEAWWDGEEKEYPGKMIHKSKLTGARRGVSESWRWYDGGLMVIKSIVHMAKKPGKQAWMLWYFESIEPVRNETFLSAKAKLKQITREQKLITEITAKQTDELKDAMKDLNAIQKAFVLEMLSKGKGGGEGAASAASSWRSKAKGIATGSEKKEREDEGPASNRTDRTDDTEFFDCDELTDEQAKALEDQTKAIQEKVARVSVDDQNPESAESAVKAKSFMCFPVSRKSVKRLPSIVQDALR